jgi:ribosome biogenesis protein Tsr3
MGLLWKASSYVVVSMDEEDNDDEKKTSMAKKRREKKAISMRVGHSAMQKSLILRTHGRVIVNCPRAKPGQLGA